MSGAGSLGGTGGLSNPVTLAQGGTGQSLTAPPQTGTLEFFAGNVQVSTSSNRARIYDDMCGTFLYDNHVSGTGATFSELVPPDNGHIGTLALQTGTTSSGSANCTYGSNGVAMIIGGGNFYFETVVNIQNLGVMGGDDYKVFFGLHDGWIFTNPPNNGFFFEYFVDTSANWIINSANGGTTTSTTTSTAVATGWTRLSFFYTVSTTTAQFFINGISVGTINTNISTNGISPCWTVFKTNGTTNRVFYIDYVDLMVDLTTAR
jgi:hypothetical protein